MRKTSRVIANASGTRPVCGSPPDRAAPRRHATGQLEKTRGVAQPAGPRSTHAPRLTRNALYRPAAFAALREPARPHACGAARAPHLN
ncbi:hypothetical protein WT60_00200 [Burkholderia sp. MSMB617WGS]|uniref:Uncharacterized protein n=1 Tax=Burkholderia savannae TaxID=1637837 RepID=A0ABR5T8Z5_9BURK|nr:hypothetical protein WS78_18225 [Burkholderia savannae]AOK45451.1 hypothetical protein WT60_00200 [Burkholderia sp. MSMB617WGS]KVG47419.1 hypothetical protein WS77_04520 [Burkholderia sp. MSMB0265]KVG82371.1 hypothetical protein WS81_01085 [Burkholderia sp. MSMB2040]KVG92614.1 hypothetical protein WS82_10370 [Burkholderia sp. MSMB2041]KVG98473.1 hypothetical protein WS83_28165 [Burkholderia sp. MSMB2042]KVK76970.1 hypothetical protein WS91_00720 [Burkholderia sp. MSMB1498]